MTAGPTTQTTAGPLLKELYTLPPVRVLNDTSYLHDKLTKEQAVLDFGGKYARFPATLNRARGEGSRGDNGVLPVAVAEVIQDAKVFMKQNYFALEWTEAIEEASKGKDGAFESVVTMKMKNVAIDMAKGLNRQWYNPTNGQYVRVGDQVDIVTTSTGVPVANGTNRAVTAISAVGLITFGDGGGNVSVTAGTHSLVLTGNWGNEIDGLQHVTNVNRILHTIDSNTFTAWNGNDLPAGLAVAGESLFEQLYDLIGQRGRGDMDTYLTTRGVRRRLADEFASQRRYLNEKSVDIKAGYRTLEVNGVETVIDDDAPKGFVFGVQRSALKVLQMTKPGFLESEAGNGAVIELKDNTVAGQKVAAWQAWYRYHCTLACTDPAVTGRISGADDDAPIINT
jgi:hypothetical protein